MKSRMRWIHMTKNQLKNLRSKGSKQYNKMLVETKSRNSSHLTRSLILSKCQPNLTFLRSKRMSDQNGYTTINPRKIDEDNFEDLMSLIDGQQEPSFLRISSIDYQLIKSKSKNESLKATRSSDGYIKTQDTPQPDEEMKNETKSP